MNRILLATLALAALAPAAVALAAAGEPVETSRVALVLKVDGGTDRIEIDDVHDLAVGESRTFTTESGKTVVATRTAEGLALEVDGKKISVPHHPLPDGEGDVVMFHKKIEIEGEDGETKTMVWHGGLPGDMKVLHHAGGEGEGYAFVSGDGALPPLPFAVEAWIERLEGSAKFQELDEATREKVREALREVAPRAGPGERKVMVFEVREEKRAGEAAPAD